MNTGVLALVLVAVCVVGVVHGQGYSLVDDWSGSNFFGNFDFFTAADPTHGYVNYVDQGTAQSKGYISAGSPIYIGVDNKNKASGRGRDSVRLTSKKSYNSGLFIWDVAHMPFGCGNWPALWTVGPNWPNQGEIDVVEGVNTGGYNAMTLHTNAGCTMNGQRSMTGKAGSTNCIGNTGCGVTDPRGTSFGQGFNTDNGGVFAMQWQSSSIRVWFFGRNGIPADITSKTPNPGAWSTPVADFPLGGSCSASHFSAHQVVIDNTFCGDWAGAVFNSMGCPGSCTAYVQNNPQDFKEAYWHINSIRVYQTRSEYNNATRTH